MKTKGPPKTPKAILKLHGSKRAASRKEPDPIPGDFSCPSDLVGESKKFWNKQMPILDKIGVMSVQDLTMFRSLCEAWGDYMDIRETNDIHTKIKLRAEITKLCSHFGMTPSTRSDVTYNKKEDDNPFMEMLVG